MEDTISLSDIKQARDHMAGLLAIQRFRAVVVPIMHEVKVKGAKRDRTQRQATGAYHVRLFEGGSVTLPASIGTPLALAIDQQIAVLTRAALLPHREALIKAARRPPGLESLRDLEVGLRHLEAANSFGVDCADVFNSNLSGPQCMLQPRQSVDTYIYFEGAEAKDRAEAYCMAVNRVLTAAFAERVAELTKALADAVSGL